MVQETGETRDAIIEEDNRKLQSIIDANKSRKEPYWIVVFAKPATVSVDGKPTLMKHMKAYASKPPSQVGAITGTVDNDKGTIEWEVNMPQRPFDFDALQLVGAKECNEVVTETTTIANAYVTQ
jgi:hypothetical protein